MPVPAGYLSDSTAAAFGSSASLIPPPPLNTQQPGVVTSLLYSGSKFIGYQKSKGNSYDVEVVLQVGVWSGFLTVKANCLVRLVMCQMSDGMIDSWRISEPWPAVSSLRCQLCLERLLTTHLFCAEQNVGMNIYFLL